MHQIIGIIMREFLVCILNSIKKIHMIVSKLEKHILSGLFLLVYHMLIINRYKTTRLNCGPRESLIDPKQ